MQEQTVKRMTKDLQDYIESNRRADELLEKKQREVEALKRQMKEKENRPEAKKMGGTTPSHNPISRRPFTQPSKRA